VELKISGDGLTNLQGYTLPWGDVKNLESVLGNIFGNSGRNIRVPPAATNAWIAEQILSAKAAGLDINTELQVARWYLHLDRRELGNLLPGIPTEPPQRRDVQKPKESITHIPPIIPEPIEETLVTQADLDADYAAMRQLEEAPVEETIW
jgi:hypothetical protein